MSSLAKKFHKGEDDWELSVKPEDDFSTSYHEGDEVDTLKMLVASNQEQYWDCRSLFSIEIGVGTNGR